MNVRNTSLSPVNSAPIPKTGPVKSQKPEFANLISKLNFYKLIPYPMDNCFTGRRDRSRQTPEKDVLYILPAGPVTECAFARWRIVLHFLFTY